MSISRKRCPQRGGFTLTELVVVVVCLALLVAILRPALAQLRNDGRGVTCTTILRDFGLAMRIYANDNAGWIPSVNTNGVELRVKEGGPVDWLHEWYLPVQSFDWMTELASHHLVMPENRAARWHMLWSYFRCPAQEADALVWPGNAPDEDDFYQYDWPACSYLMPAYFSYWGDAHRGTVLAYHEIAPTWPVYAQTVPDSWAVGNENYLSRLDEVGPAERKIFLADGTRFVAPNDIVDFDASPWPTFFGAFTTLGGWESVSNAYGVAAGTRNWSGNLVADGNTSDGANLPLTYRHRRSAQFTQSSGLIEPDGNPSGALRPGHPASGGPGAGSAQANQGTINAVFFDGHVESSMTDRQSRNVEFWYPSGSVVRSPTYGMTTLPYGYEIP